MIYGNLALKLEKDFNPPYAPGYQSTWPLYLHDCHDETSQQEIKHH